MKKLFLLIMLAVSFVMTSAQTNQYFWYKGNLMMGNPISQIDSVTFGNDQDIDTLHILLPRTVVQTVTVHDTVYVHIHDTVCPDQHMFNGHEYVDLGLPSGTMWATMNLGATVPSDSGSCYAWGETTPKTTFTQSNYQHYQGGSYVNIGSDISGTQYDAATYLWGTGWQMPTYTQCQELISNTTRSDTVINGVSCMIVKSNINNNSIIVPGIFDEGGTISTGHTCYGHCFWTSTECGTSTAYRQWEWSSISFGWKYQWYPIRPIINSSTLSPAPMPKREK